MTKCEACYMYENPIQTLLYPNCDNEEIGWVRCGAGNIVKRNTMGCHKYDGPDIEVAVKIDIVKAPKSVQKKQAKKLEVRDEIANFADPMERLRDAINGLNNK